MDLNTKLMSAATAWKEAHDNFLASVAEHGEDSSRTSSACDALAEAENALKEAIEEAPTQALFASSLLFAQPLGRA